MKHILLVEDDPWLADCMATWLQTAGHTVVWARDIIAALDACDEQIPDVIVLDIMLPAANGVQLLHQLASYDDVAKIPVILCSSIAPPHIIDLAAYGVRLFLDKAHVTPYSLRAAVKEVTHAAI